MLRANWILLGYRFLSDILVSSSFLKASSSISATIDLTRLFFWYQVIWDVRIALSSDNWSTFFTLLYILLSKLLLVFINRFKKEPNSVRRSNFRFCLSRIEVITKNKSKIKVELASKYIIKLKVRILLGVYYGNNQQFTYLRILSNRNVMRFEKGLKNRLFTLIFVTTLGPFFRMTWGHWKESYGRLLNKFCLSISLGPLKVSETSIKAADKLLNWKWRSRHQLYK